MITVALGAAITASSMFYDEELAEEGEKEGVRRKARIMSRTIYFSSCGLAALIVSLNVDRLVVILLASVFNGALLPFFSICLLLCINEPCFMSRAPQKGWSNVLMVLSVSISLFLAANTIIGRVLGGVLEQVLQRVLLAAGLALVGMVVLCGCTTLGANLARSWGWKRDKDSGVDSIEG